MKVLFAVHDEKVSLSIVKKYQKEYKEIISYKNVYYFNAILRELQRDKSYDRVVIDEELEEFTSTSYEEKDKFIFNKLDSITDEALNAKGSDIPIILICSDRRTKSEDILVKLFGIGIYNAIIGNDRSTDEVCRLLYSPRSKKDAKLYYKIDSKAVDYDPEHENDVSEEEMQHILSYFKKLGKDQDKYVEAFRKIVSQYNEKQMRIIITILPINVKAALEEASPEYQKIAMSSGIRVSPTRKIKSYQQPTLASETLLDGGNKDKNRSPVVIPSSMDKNLIKKVTIRKPSPVIPIEEDLEDDFEEDFKDEQYNDLTDLDDLNPVDEFKEIEEIPEIKPAPKKRGRPRKTPQLNQDEGTITAQPVKRKRGRPKKVVQDLIEEENQFEDILPGFDEIGNENDNDNENEELDRKPINEDLLGPKFEDFDDEDEDDNSLPGLSDEEEDLLPGVNDNEEEYEEYEQEEDYEQDNNSLPGLDSDETFEKEYIRPETSNIRPNDMNMWENKPSNTDIQNYGQNYYDSYDYTNYNNLLSSDRKVIAFVGTSKNGTSFIVNNVARLLSENGIDTAILDATQNKNSYYIYNSNDDGLRATAANSIQSLIQGNPEGMKVSKNLSVYVEVPGQEDTQMDNVGPILENLIKHHSAVLIDCDFNTPLEYFANAMEIFLVQNMDVLTIQPLTAFLKELKNKDILDQNKLRIIVNKTMKLRGITPKQIIGGMSNYNNPEMSIMTELFDRNLIVPIEIPFDIDVYARYLEGLADCDINTNKYPREFQEILKKLVGIIYPLLPARSTREKPQKGYQYPGYTNGFSNSVNNTLNNMKKNY